MTDQSQFIYCLHSGVIEEKVDLRKTVPMHLS